VSFAEVLRTVVDEALAVPEQELDQVRAAPAEREHVAAERVLPEHLLHAAGKPVESAAHVRRARGQPHPDARRQADHASKAAAKRATAAASASAVSRSTRPLRRTISIGARVPRDAPGAEGAGDGGAAGGGAGSGATRRTGSSRGGGRRFRAASPRAARR
jgi:hypothetical protein